MGKKSKDAKYVRAKELDTLKSCEGQRCTHIGFGSRGLSIIFDEHIQFTFDNAWRILKKNKIKVGSGDFPKIFDDPEMKIFDKESDKIYKKAQIVLNLKCKSVEVNSNLVKLEFTDNINIVSFNCSNINDFWSISKKREFVWGVVFDLDSDE
jgi:hypothetical protein